MSTSIAGREARWRAYWSAYRTMARMSVLAQFQYRVSNYLYMLGMVAEPVIYLVVWSTIARSGSGSIEGYTPGRLAAYYIVWTLVRNMNIVFTPAGWEERIRSGELSGHLLRPIHPIHYDIAYFAGWKLVVIVLWLPIAAGLSLVFHPALDPSVLQVVVFAIAIWGAYLVRTMLLWILGMVSFWTTRVSALYEAYFTVELLFSGRLVPLALVPHWMRVVSWALPFRWAFGYPIDALVGPIGRGALVGGLAMQLVWITAGAGAVQLVWRAGTRRYGAVGG